jgi:hypothetical protein
MTIHSRCRERQCPHARSTCAEREAAAAAGRLVRDIVGALVARMANSDDRHVVSLCAWVVSQQRLPLRHVEETDPGTCRALVQVLPPSPPG